MNDDQTVQGPDSTHEESPDPCTNQESASRPWLAVLVFVGVWTALGWLLRLDANRYLLLGVPLTLLFQVVVRRQPLRSLWVRDAPPLRVTPAWLLLATAIAALPITMLLREGVRHGWVSIAWLACAILGAPAAVYCLQNWGRAVRASFGAAFLMVAGVSALLLLGAAAQGKLTRFGIEQLLIVARWSLLYFAVGFVLEEVTFRGMLDAHLHRGGETRHGDWIALGLSFLWGLWHLPIVPVGDALLLTAVRLGFWHMLDGVPLTTAWRRSGNLLAPVAAHAVLNGVRNAVQSL